MCTLSCCNLKKNVISNSFKIVLTTENDSQCISFSSGIVLEQYQYEVNLFQNTFVSSLYLLYCQIYNLEIKHLIEILSTCFPNPHLTCLSLPSPSGLQRIVLRSLALTFKVTSEIHSMLLCWFVKTVT